MPPPDHFNPSLLLFGGGVSGAGDLLLPRNPAGRVRAIHAPGHRNLRIDITRQGDTAAATGAAFAIIEQLLRADRFEWSTERNRGAPARRPTP